VILDDHDHVSGDKVRFSSDAASDHRVVAGVAIQLFSLGIACIYYGTEQAFAGPEKSERDKYLPDYNVGNPPPDKYLREAMFGPSHPRRAGAAGLQSGSAGSDPKLPGFGPFGSVGHHCFDPSFPTYFEVVANPAQAAAAAFAGTHPVGERLPVKQREGAAFVEIRDVPPSEVVVLVSRP
jgi:hypothetical protein